MTCNKIQFDNMHQLKNTKTLTCCNVGVQSGLFYQTLELDKVILTMYTFVFTDVLLELKKQS